MIEADRHYLRLEIRENLDPESKSGRAWLIDLCDLNGRVIGEAIGAAETLLEAMEEAGEEITHYIVSEVIDKKLRQEESK